MRGRFLSTMAAILGIASPVAAAPSPVVRAESAQLQAQDKQAPVTPTQQAPARAALRMALHVGTGTSGPRYFQLEEMQAPAWVRYSKGTARRPNAQTRHR